MTSYDVNDPKFPFRFWLKRIENDYTYNAHFRNIEVNFSMEMSKCIISLGQLQVTSEDMRHHLAPSRSLMCITFYLKRYSKNKNIQHVLVHLMIYFVTELSELIELNY